MRSKASKINIKSEDEMSNGHKLELLSGNGEVFLNYWDSIAGDDVIFILRNGKTYMHKNDDSEKEVDLAEELSNLATRADDDVKKLYNTQ